MKQTVYTATEARANFFDILNRAYYGGETILVKKNDKLIVTITSPTYTGKKIDWGKVHKLSGKLTDHDADIIRKAIEESDKLPGRTHDPLSP